EFGQKSLTALHGIFLILNFPVSIFTKSRTYSVKTKAATQNPAKNGRRTSKNTGGDIQRSSSLKDEQRKKLFLHMLQAREFDMAMLRLYRQGRAFGGVYAQIGNEATAVGSAFALRESDALFPMHRDIGSHFVRGQSLDALMLNHTAREG